MKIVIIIALLFSANPYNQSPNDGLEAQILSIYKEEAKIYLHQFSKIGFEKKELSTNETQAVNAKYNKYLADILLIEKSVQEQIKKYPNGSNDKLYISKVVAAEYKNKFVGLPKAFWDQVARRVEAL